MNSCSILFSFFILLLYFLSICISHRFHRILLYAVHYYLPFLLVPFQHQQIMHECLLLIDLQIYPKFRDHLLSNLFFSILLSEVSNSIHLLSFLLSTFYHNQADHIVTFLLCGLFPSFQLYLEESHEMQMLFEIWY